MAEEAGKAGVPPQKLSKEEIVEWWKQSCVEVGSDIDDLRMSRVSTITMFWLFILFGIFLLIALPTVNTKVEVWVTVSSALLFALVAIWAFVSWKKVKVKLAEAEARAAKR
jgi:Ca2+/Na+ antiporter